MNDRHRTHLNLTNPDFFPVISAMLHNDIKVRFRVTGRSMVPFLDGGEFVTVEKIRTRDLVPGDLVLMNDQSTVMVHRLIDKKQVHNSWRFVTKGDGVSRYDLPVTGENILGKVCLVEKTTAAGRYTVNLELPAWKRINRLFALLSRGRRFSGWLSCFPFKFGITEYACQVCWCRFSK